MKGLDLRKFKKISSSKEHTMLKHPDGHEIKVAHHRLSPGIKEQLDKLPNYDDGGSVKPSTPPQPPPNGTPESAQASMRKAFHFKDGGVVPSPTPVIEGEAQQVPASKLESQYGPEDQAAMDVVAESAPVQIADASPTPAPAPTPEPTPVDASHAHLAEAVKNLSQKFVNEPTSPAPQTTPQAAPQMAPQVSGQPSGSLIDQAQANVAQQNQAETGMAQNTANTQANVAEIQGQSAKQMQDLGAKYEQIGTELHNKFESLAHTVEQGHIDPSHWWNSKSTGSKVLTAIGMLFSGAAVGAGGHPEMASQAIDHAIERDIDAQKADLSNKNTLLGKYMDMYRSLPEAENAARLTMHAGVEGLINQQAAKLGSQNALLTAQSANAARRQALLPNLESLAKGQMMMNLYGDMSKQSSPTSSDEQAYQNQMSKMRLINPDLGKDMENKYLPGVGSSRVPIPDALRESITVRKDLSDKIAQLENFTKQHAGTTMDRAVVNQGKAMAAQVQDSFRSAHQQGVFKESEKNFVNSILSADPTSFFANARTLPGYRQARAFNDQTIQQYYKSYGIKPFQNSPQQQSQAPTATNPKTGEKLMQKDGKWVPYGQ